MADQVQIAGFTALALVTLAILAALIVLATAIHFELRDRRHRRRALRTREASRLATRQERAAIRALTPRTRNRAV